MKRTCRKLKSGGDDNDASISNYTLTAIGDYIYFVTDNLVGVCTMGEEKTEGI